MTEHQYELGGKVFNSILDASQSKAIHDIACKANNKKVTKSLVKNELRWDTGVRTTYYNGKRFLTLRYFLSTFRILPWVLLCASSTTLVTIK